MSSDLVLSQQQSVKEIEIETVPLVHPADTITVLSIGTSDERLSVLRERLRAFEGTVHYEAVAGVETGEQFPDRPGPTCIVASQDLADGEGLEALRRCLAHYPEAVTILLADDPTAALIEDAYAAGVDEVVHYTGPEKRAVVAHHVETHLGTGRRSAESPTERQQLTALAATTSDAIVTVDEGGTIRYTNPAVTDVLGYDPDELVGEPLTTLIPPDLVDRHRERLTRYLETGERTIDWNDIELPGRRADGQTVPLSVAFSEFVDDGERYFTGVMRDVTDRKRLAAERDLYHDATQRILGADSFEDGLRIALDAVGSAMDWQYGEAWTARDERLGCVDGSYTTSAASEAFGATTTDWRFERGEGLVGRVWETATAEWMVDVTGTDAPFERSAAAADAGLRAALGVPIVSDGSVVAVLVFFLEEPREVDEGMLEATRTIAADLGRLMERLEAETALRAERNLNERILETSPVGIAILGTDGTFSYSNDRAAEILGAEDLDPPFGYDDLDVELLSFDGRPVAGDEAPYRRLAEVGESVSGVLRLLVGGETRWLSVHGTPLDVDERPSTTTVLSLHDVTDRKRRERRLLQQETAMNTVGDGLYALDEADRFVVVNDAYCELIGYDRTELLGRPASDIVGDDVTEAASALQADILDGRTDEATMETTLTTATGDRVPVEARISLFASDEDTVGRAGVVRDISDRKRREERLVALNEVGQALTVAETPGDVADIVVEGAREILDLPLTTVEFYDEASGALRPGPRSPELVEVVGEGPLFDSEWGLLWQVYAESAGRVFDDLREEPTGETPLESAIVLPVGSHGVFVAGATTHGSFTETDALVARILVANAIAALDRVDREQALRTQKARLEERNESLERVDRLNGVIRGLTRELTEASTRTEVEAALCAELAEADPYLFAWVGEHRPGTDRIEPRASAGREDGYLDAITVTADEEPTGLGPAGTALRTGEPAVQNDLHTDPPFEPWRTEAMQRGYRASISVPLVYRETVYGVLNLYASEPNVFDETEVAVLDELGRMVGYAINAIERRKALVSDSAVELTLGVDDPSVPPVALARETGGTFELDGLVERSDETFRVFFAVDGATPEAVYHFAERTPTIERLTLLSEEETRSRYEAVVTDDGFFSELLGYGAHPTGMVVDEDGGRVTVELPQSGDVQTFIRTFVRRYDEAELLARRTRNRPVQSVAEFEASYKEHLTVRQQEVLETAYFSGFFEWPRETSGKELAGLLGISQPTVSRHIRTGERKLFGLVFDDD
ncbi:PAS domain S-box protein [Halomarina oriensis]|uniref:PAS domain S-box protein n=1 Tax=Halomarina oriensis TaxID=671145 RepID=A0A6B0GLZ8_9EURY|nr:PAS domain S-box protein [Halomarina oriensis]MWG34509.1 PAS domain S-box protein [Halomarina oriensis]